MPPSPHLPLTRRALLAGGTGLLVAGCAVQNPLGTEKTPAAEAVRELAPDVAIAVEAVTRIKAAAAAVAAATQADPALTGRVAGLVRLHDAHLAAVRDAVPDGVDTSATATPAPAGGRPASALDRLLAAERGLHGQLTALALRAESGPFARLLGSMAAGVSQQLATLRTAAAR
jgi:hypothetical protein